ncbi:HAD family phosphatase [Paracoccus aurantiacus]|uniref:HAD family phosphatase n=1 Tax=Paracoccus aurantiacus TaxID=2599412 RepID=A0A5C6S046_9RHOB|nr:HAD family phosphatase [Paracoccus aurantiacus]TXB67747.1 HAD family phosphatase [Paracoccus aurantiacus]
MQNGLSGFQAAIFDLDGTLIDSEPAWEMAKRAIAARHGRPITDAQIAASVGRSMDQLLIEVFDPATPAAARAIEEEVYAAVDEWMPQLRKPVPGAAEFLRDLHRFGLRIALCSSSPERLIRDALMQIDVLEIVDLIVSADPLPRRKPDPMPYEVTAEKLGLPHKALVVFEDAIAGVRSAKGAGLFTVGIGPETALPEFSICDLRAPDYPALRAILGM